MKNLLLLFSVFFLLACKKDGTGGNGEIKFSVRHHDDLIPGAIVYIKYGAKEFPGEDVSKYDASFQTPSTGTEAGKGSFTGLLRGDYFIYSTGFDSTANRIVIGGVPVEIKKDQKVEVIVPVTE